MNDRLVESILKVIRTYQMLKPGDNVLVGVSGGPDSVCLLYALNSLKNKLKLKTICVCNMDHGLRGDESRTDSAFVKKLSARLGMRFVHKRIDLRKKRQKKLSVEESARAERYKFFKAAAARTKAAVIATGHTLDDQAETVLMRIIKGSSLKGLIGISPVRIEGRFRFIRPLIELEKGEIASYLEMNNIPYRIDRSNSEPIYFRNIVRSQIIPFLEKYNPRIKRAIFNLSGHLREDFEFIENEKRRTRKNLGYTAGYHEVLLKDIAVQPKAIQKEILRDMLENSDGMVKKLSFRHWKAMENLISCRDKGKSVDLPGGIRVTRTDRTIKFNRI